MRTLTGIDVLIRDDLKPLHGQRVGLITNHTGLARDGRPTIDVLHEHASVRLAALFGPEHGIRGEADAPVNDSIDTRTGLPVYSLYGQSSRPAPEQLKGLDALVYDIQDVGCRYYTYISTLGAAIEEAARAGIHMVVLDRPNPITGTSIEGPVSDDDDRSFTAWHPMPVRHGMTVGELARLFNIERKLGAGLIVIPCEGWRRSEWWDATGLTWTNPSPNMRSLTQAALYPGIGLPEFTNISVGRGTDTPFENIGAPWLDGARLAERLNDASLPGIRCVPIRFTPRASIFAGRQCGGVSFIVTNRDRFQPVRFGIEVATALRDLYPADWKPQRYSRLLANKRAFSSFMAGATPVAIENGWREELRAFIRTRRDYLIYE